MGSKSTLPNASTFCYDRGIASDAASRKIELSKYKSRTFVYAHVVQELVAAALALVVAEHAWQTQKGM
jgi:hypothetical protein